jgi:hypothetical protein
MATGPPRRAPPPNPRPTPAVRRSARVQVAEAQGGDIPRDNDGPSEVRGAEAEEDTGKEDADEEDDAGGPQAFSAGWYEARRDRRIPPRFEITGRFDPNTPSRSRPGLWHISSSSVPGTRRQVSQARQLRSTAAPPASRRSPKISPAMGGRSRVSMHSSPKPPPIGFGRRSVPSQCPPFDSWHVRARSLTLRAPLRSPGYQWCFRPGFAGKLPGRPRRLQ